MNQLQLMMDDIHRNDVLMILFQQINFGNNKKESKLKFDELSNQ